jgi:Uma2 family endonuclease
MRDTVTGEGFMATQTQIFVPIETYLRNSDYEPDAEYVDGRIEERNLGEFDHNTIQQLIQVWFFMRRKEWNVRAIQEQRTRVSATRVRIPDVCVFGVDFPIQQVFGAPPLICIEVLSPEDRRSRMQEKMNDYRAFGVANIWVIDPKTRAGWDVSTGDWIPVERFAVEGTPVYLALDELFASID